MKKIRFEKPFAEIIYFEKNVISTSEPTPTPVPNTLKTVGVNAGTVNAGDIFA